MKKSKQRLDSRQQIAVKEDSRQNSVKEFQEFQELLINQKEFQEFKESNQENQILESKSHSVPEFMFATSHYVPKPKQETVVEFPPPALKMNQISHNDMNQISHNDIIPPQTNVYMNQAHVQDQQYYQLKADEYLEYSSFRPPPPSATTGSAGGSPFFPPRDKDLDKQSWNTLEELLPVQDEMSRKKFMYCCIPTKRSSRNVCLVITGLVLVTLGVLGYLFYPRSPDMKFEGIDLKSSNSYKLSNFDKANPNNFSFSMDMVMNVAVQNTNWYHIKVDSIDLQAFLMANGTLINEAIPSPAHALLTSSEPRVWVTSENFKSLIATGKHGPITFPQGVTVKFNIPLRIQYTPSPTLGLVNDPAFNEIVQLCVDVPSNLSDRDLAKARKTTITYQADNSVGLLRFIGFTPTQSGSFQINCPFQGKARTDFLASLGQSTK